MEKLKYGLLIRDNVLLRIPNQIRHYGQQSGFLRQGEASRSQLRERLVASHSIAKHLEDLNC